MTPWALFMLVVAIMAVILIAVIVLSLVAYVWPLIRPFR